MALDPGPIGKAAAELMDSLEDIGDEAELIDALVIVELGLPDGTVTRWRGTTDRATVMAGMAAVVVASMTSGDDIESDD